MKNSGFTLVEMAVVLVIIALVASAVLAGNEVIEASRTRSVTAEIRGRMQSFEQFVDRYRAYPGDFRLASTTFSVDATFDGDGNNKIEWAQDEGVKGWYHLQLAGLIEGASLLGTAQSGHAIIRTNIPASDSEGFGYYLDYNTTMQNHLGLGRQQESGINNAPALSPMRADGIDRKMDDGKPQTGFVQATGDSCIALGAYDMTSDDTRDAISCLLLVRLS